mgnify:CR=1 FL=1
MSEDMLLLETRIMKMFREQEQDIKRFCKKYQLECFLQNGFVRVKDFVGKWYITSVSGQKKLLVYHKNTANKESSMIPTGYPQIPGYHLQKFKGNTIVELLEMIYDHMQIYETRQNLPKWVYKQYRYRYYSRKKSASQKSGRTRAKEHRAEKHFLKKQRIKNVLDMINSLSVELPEG